MTKAAQPIRKYLALEFIAQILLLQTLPTRQTRERFDFRRFFAHLLSVLSWRI